MTPSEAVIFRSQIVESYNRHIDANKHKVDRLDKVTRGAVACEYQALTTSSLFTWRADLFDAVVTAASTLPSPVTFADSLRPCSSGFYLFPKPVTFEGCARPIVALAWYDVQPLTMFWTYIDTAGTSWKDLGQIAAYGVFGVANGVDIVQTEAQDMRQVQNDSSLSKRGIESTLRFVLASWLWMQQKVMRLDKGDVSSHAKKLADRVNTVSEVNVVVLRRSEAGPRSECGGKSVEWACKWLVRGHWRQQFYPSTSEHRPLWIEPYVKGPDDKPLRMPGQTVYAVNR